MTEGGLGRTVRALDAEVDSPAIFDPPVGHAGRLTHAKLSWSGDELVRLELTVDHGGVSVALLLAQLGWYAGLARTPSLLRTAATSAAGAVAGPFVQWAVVVSSVALLTLGAPALGASWLGAGSRLALVVAVIAWVELYSPRRGNA